MMKSIVLVAHNLRSTHNVGSLLRTAEGLGVHRVYLTGYTPYPIQKIDARLPHLAQKLDKQIAKTALGAQQLINWEHHADVMTVMNHLKRHGYLVAALEQTVQALPLPDFAAPDKIALIIGREVGGIEQEVLNKCDLALEIPMFGHKESFNVVQAAAMALFHFRFTGSDSP